MTAFANEVMEKVSKRYGNFDYYFDGLTMVVSPCYDNYNLHYQLIVGQKLLLVDWQKTHDVEVHCPDRTCTGMLNNERTIFSKNKTLLPIFGLEGAPSWCMLQTMQCCKCCRQFDVNNAQVLLTLPAYVAEAYPVEMKYCLPNKKCHLMRHATQVFDSLMLTYGNGEVCSKMLYASINAKYLSRLKTCYSYIQIHPIEGEAAVPFVEKNSEYIRQYPPLGDTIRDMYNEAASSNSNPWRISNFDRNTREIQSVSCQEGIMAQDHTFIVVKN